MPPGFQNAPHNQENEHLGFGIGKRLRDGSAGWGKQALHGDREASYTSSNTNVLSGGPSRKVDHSAPALPAQSYPVILILGRVYNAFLHI